MSAKVKLRVLVACEFSGVVREAFKRRGWDAWSCDLLPSEKKGNHIEGDISEALQHPWDLIINHPPCTNIANSSSRWLYVQGTTKKVPKRWKLMREGAAFFKMLHDHPAPHKATENPVMLGHAKKLIFGSVEAGAATQVIQPWMFGRKRCKATCLWLVNLPPLTPTDNVYEETMALPYGERCAVHFASPGPNRGKLRSVTEVEIAQAMADQWGAYIEGLRKGKR